MGNLEDKFNPARLAVAAADSEPTASRYRRSNKPEYMPEVSWSLFTSFAALPGKAGWVGMAIYRLTVMRKKTTVTVKCAQVAEQLGINPKAVYNALTVLHEAGLIRAERKRGSFATVELLQQP